MSGMIVIHLVGAQEDSGVLIYILECFCALLSIADRCYSAWGVSVVPSLQAVSPLLSPFSLWVDSELFGIVAPSH